MAALKVGPGSIAGAGNRVEANGARDGWEGVGVSVVDDVVVLVGAETHCFIQNPRMASQWEQREKDVVNFFNWFKNRAVNVCVS